MSRIRMLIDSYEIVCGWDNDYQHFFGSVQDTDVVYSENEDGDDVFYYNSIDDPEADVGGGFPDLNVLKSKINKIIKVPDHFWKEVLLNKSGVVKTIT